MTLDCDPYRVNMKSVEQLTRAKTYQERFELIGTLAIVTNVPIIVVCCYMGELYGFDDKLKDFIKRLKEFYTIDTILNAKTDQTL